MREDKLSLVYTLSSSMVVPQLLSVRRLQEDQPSPGRIQQGDQPSPGRIQQDDQPSPDNMLQEDQLSPDKMLHENRPSPDLRTETSEGTVQPCIPVICVIDEDDNNDFVECRESNSENPNFLHPESADLRPGASSRLSANSSTLSFFSVASSRLSSKIDLEAGKALCHRSTGLLLAFLSGVLMTVYSSMIKFLVEMDSMQVVIIRGVIQAVVLGAVAYYKKMSFIGSKERCVPVILFFVSITGGLRLLFIFTSFSRLPLGDSTTIIFSSPVFVMLLSICILKEHKL